MNNDWYMSLKQSSLTPPPYVFGIVWPVLYALMAWSAWTRYTALPGDPTWWWPYAVQIVLNVLWVQLFFRLHWIGAAFVVILGITANLAWTVKTLEPRLAAALLVPNLLWVAFASYLNGYVWWRNG